MGFLTEKEAQEAHEFLRTSAAMVKPIAKQARDKLHQLKHVEGLMVKQQEGRNIPATLREKYARAETRYKEMIEEEAEAFAEWESLQERRATAKITISLYQSEIKDRL